MIKILILDDDPLKIEKIKSLIFEQTGVDRDAVHVARDLISGRDRLRLTLYDLLILDLRLPNRFGDEPHEDAGKDFIRELQGSQTLVKPFHIIGLTAFEEVLQKTAPAFAEAVWRIIRYDPATTTWGTQLSNHIRYLVESKRALRDSDTLEHGYDLAIITALHSPELRSVLQLPAQWAEVHPANDTSIYYTGVLRSQKRAVRVVAASSHQMGMTAAAVLSMKLANYFRPKYLVACGIAAGLRNAGIGMGDLLIADQTWDYESGKKKIAESGEVFLPDPKYIPLQNSLKERLIATIGEGAYLADIEAGWNAARPGTKLRAHIGPVASGSAIIQNEKIIDGIQRQARKVIGLEMETYGVFFAGENCTRPKPIPFSIKGACDYADSQKNDDYQEYAAYTSAQYICRFALDHLGEELHP